MTQHTEASCAVTPTGSKVLTVVGNPTSTLTKLNVFLIWKNHISTAIVLVNFPLCLRRIFGAKDSKFKKKTKNIHINKLFGWYLDKEN